MLFGKRCAKAGIEISMGSVGDCYDNAVCETFHATLKKEKIYRQSWPTRAEARTAVFAYIEGWYNPRRRHSTLAYLSPIEFERQHTELAQLALGPDIGQRIGRGDRAEGLRLAHNASHLDGRRRFRRPRPDLSRERPRSSDRSRSGRDGRPSRDERQPLASPLYGQGTGPLIQQSTPTAKTCRPNRGRSSVPRGCACPEAPPWRELPLALVPVAAQAGWSACTAVMTTSATSLGWEIMTTCEAPSISVTVAPMRS